MNADTLTTAPCAVHSSTGTEEFNALFSQLTLVQEELERQYRQKKELPQPATPQGTTTQATPGTGAPQTLPVQLLNYIAESIRIQELDKARALYCEAEGQHSVAARLGKAVLAGSVLGVPARLLHWQRLSKQSTPPQHLGGKSFTRVCQVFSEKGMEGVDALLATTELSPAMQANAYTALARHLQDSAPAQAAHLAEQAYLIDPQPYRLKWLAFRQFTAELFLEAEATLALVPQDTAFTDSEQRLAGRVQKKGEAVRLAQAKAIEKSLTVTNPLAEQQLAAMTQEHAALKTAYNSLQAEYSSMQVEHNALQAEYSSVQAEHNSLQANNTALQQENRTLNEKHTDLLHQLTEQQATALYASKMHIQAEQEKQALTLQVQQLEAHNAAYDKKFDTMLQSLNTLSSQQAATLKAQEQHVKEEFLTQRKWINNHLTSQLSTTRLQLEASRSIHHFFATGTLPFTLPFGTTNWPVKPDFSLLLLKQIVQGQYDLIIEFGSGISTVIMALAIAELQRLHPEQLATALVSFDHLEQYFTITRNLLSEHKVDSLVDLTLAPLQDYKAPNGTMYPYYDCASTLASLAQQHPGNCRIMAVIDGPPASTGPHARYPAAPMLLQAFPKAQIDFILDDYIRTDEKEIATMWQGHFSQTGQLSHSAHIMLEKEACLIRTFPLPMHMPA